jgi:hypothetical protein
VYLLLSERNKNLSPTTLVRDCGERVNNTKYSTHKQKGQSDTEVDENTVFKDTKIILGISEYRKLQ